MWSRWLWLSKNKFISGSSLNFKGANIGAIIFSKRNVLARKGKKSQKTQAVPRSS